MKSPYHVPELSLPCQDFKLNAQMIALYIAAIVQYLLGCATDEPLLFSGCLANGTGLFNVLSSQGSSCLIAIKSSIAF